tara:strand:+ start:1145 stop:2320 length:1176 start_codon:yes stop_codon:yes gene_type:complete
VKTLLDEVLERIRPDENETTKINKIYNNLKNKITKRNLDSLIVGSIAKGTNLKGADIDLFIRFDEDTDLKSEGLKVAREILTDGKELYAQHPYLRGEIEGIGIDLVPCYAIKDSSKSISAVDRTPFHTKWVTENIAGKEDEVRLAKQFLKGAGAYGANAAIGGFSGYLVEILIIRYENFENLVRKISLWKPPIIIEDVKNAPKAAMMIKDPVDERRNVSAGVTLKGLGTAILAAKGFLNNPTLDFFFPKNKIRKSKGIVTTVTLPHPGGNEETVLPWLQRQGRKINKAIADFEPIAWNANLGNNCFLVFETATVELPDIVSHKGPPPWEDGALDFLKKYPDATLSSKRLEIGRPPRHSKIDEVILELIPNARVQPGLLEGAKPVQRMPWLD